MGAGVQRSATAKGDDGDLTQFGYEPKLRRVMGPLASFALSFSMISVTTGIFFLFSGVFTTSRPSPSACS